MTHSLGIEHFIPIRKAELAGLLVSQTPPAEQLDWLRFFGICSALYHHYFQVQLDHLKDLYAPFDPDSDTRPVTNLCPDAELEGETAFFESLDRLLQQGNFRQLSWEQVASEKTKTNRLGLHMRMDPAVFERLEVYVRGESLVDKKRSKWWKLWEPKNQRVPTYHRMVLALRLRPNPEINSDMPREGIHLKLFRRVPKDDLDLLLPGSRMRLSGLDKGLIGFPLATGVIMLLGNALLTLVSAGINVLGGLLSWSAAIAIGGYGLRSYSAWKSKHNQYSFKVNKHLYYQKLDSNLGAVLRLIDEAEEQECREAWLAFHALAMHAPPEGWTARELDTHCEDFLKAQLGTPIDFEEADALLKLARMGLITETAGRYRPIPLTQAVLKLDALWDGLFPENAHTMNEGASRLAKTIANREFTKTHTPRN